MMKDRIIRYYDGYDEDTRLIRHPVEFITTTYLVRPFIRTGDYLLDVAAGTGAYALYFARMGMRVVACDLVPEHVAALVRKSREQKIRLINARVADARNLSDFSACIGNGTEPNGFDVVLCMGPVYHVASCEVPRCIIQCRSVLKKNGILVIAYLNRYHGYASDKYADDLLFHAPFEIDDLAEGAGIRKIMNVPVDGEVFGTMPLSGESEALLAAGHEWLQRHPDAFYDGRWTDTARHALYIGVAGAA